MFGGISEEADSAYDQVPLHSFQSWQNSLLESLNIRLVDLPRRVTGRVLAIESNSRKELSMDKEHCMSEERNRLPE